MAKNRYNIGQRFGKLELMSIDTTKGMYKLICECGKFVSRPCNIMNNNLPPRSCNDCKMDKQRETSRVNNSFIEVRENTDKEAQMIKRFKNA